MAQVINTNIASLNVQRNLNVAQSTLSSSMQRLSSGLRINSAKDDAAGMAIASRMAAQINGLTQGARNLNDGISLTQTGEGGLDQVSEILRRGRDLAVQAANGTNAASDREGIQNNWEELVDQVDTIANGTAFNGQKLLDGSFSGAIYQTGTGSDGMVAVGAIGNMSAAHLGRSDQAQQGLRSVDLSTQEGASAAIAVFDAALEQVNSQRAELGASQNLLSSTINNLSTVNERVQASRSRIDSADYAQQVSDMARSQMLQQAGTSVLAQANQLPPGVLSLLRG